MIDPRLKNGIIIVVTTIWATNFLAGLVIKSYEPDQAINAIFMGIVGGLFALGVRDNSGGGKSSPPESKKEPESGTEPGGP